MMPGGSLTLKQLHARGFDDAKIVEMGGVIQGANVLFKDKVNGFDSTGAVLKVAPRPKSPTFEQWAVKHGPALWAKLHRWALAFDPSQALAEPNARAWLSSFSNYLWCGKCKSHWREIVKANPPTFDSADALFEWTWRMHSLVNEKLGKPNVTLEQAKEIYRKTDP